MISAVFSDPHFGHENHQGHGIRNLAHRPFSSITEMDETIIRRYNDRIGMNDIVLWLGDAFLCQFDRAAEIMSQMNGIKLLILGNHDRSVSTMTRLGFSLIMNEASLNIAGRTCRFCHYPYAGVEHNRGEDDRYLEKRPERRKGEVLIHGHTHKPRQIFENMIHVGVDAWNFGPVLYDELAQIIAEHFPI